MTDWTASGLLPVAVANSVLTAVEESSAVLSLATVRRMPAGIEYLPLPANAPKATWIETGERKPYQPVEWSAEKLVAREIALTTYVEDALIADTTFDIERETEAALGSAIARALDAALLFGEDAPPGFPPNGIATTPVTGSDPLTALSAAMAEVEASGIPVTGIVASAAIGVALRAAYLEAGDIASAPADTVFGVPVRISPVWDPTKGDAVVGDFRYLVVGVRRDISVETSTDGVLTDGDAIIANAFEQDLTLLRAHARFAAAIGKPIGAGGDPIVPFATAQWTTASGTSVPASEPAARATRSKG